MMGTICRIVLIALVAMCNGCTVERVAGISVRRGDNEAEKLIARMCQSISSSKSYSHEGTQALILCAQDDRPTIVKKQSSTLVVTRDKETHAQYGDQSILVSHHRTTVNANDIDGGREVVESWQKRMRALEVRAFFEATMSLAGLLFTDEPMQVIRRHFRNLHVVGCDDDSDGINWILGGTFYLYPLEEKTPVPVETLLWIRDRDGLPIKTYLKFPEYSVLTPITQSVAAESSSMENSNNSVKRRFSLLENIRITEYTADSTSANPARQ